MTLVAAFVSTHRYMQCNYLPAKAVKNIIAAVTTADSTANLRQALAVGILLMEWPGEQTQRLFFKISLRLRQEALVLSAGAV